MFIGESFFQNKHKNISMTRLARSKSCLGTGGKREQSPSPENHRRTGEKRGRRRSYDRKQDGGESSYLKRSIVRERGRNRSKSPRRNSWREEIKKIKSWREDKEIKRTGLEMKISHHRSKDDGEFKNLNDRSYKKFKKLSQKDGVPRETSPCNKRNNRIDEPDRLNNKKERISLTARRYESSSSENMDGFSTNRREFKGSQKKLSKKPKRLCSVKIRRATSDSDSEELELIISDADVFPELRDDCYKKAVAGTSFDEDTSSTERSEKFVSLEIEVRANENEESSRRSVRLKDGQDKTEDQVNPGAGSTNLPAEVVAESDQGFAVSGSSLLSNEYNSSASCVSASASASSLVDGNDSSVMERNFSLLELKMEVYTTRLKELEWEREQLRKEREVLQGQEQYARRELLSRLQERERLSFKISDLENENKENRG